VSVNALRRTGRNHEELDEQYDGVPQPPDVIDRKLAVRRLVEEINDLPERQRSAIVAYEIEGRSYEEIAHSMSATTPIVRQLVHRARIRLRDACGVVVPTWALRWLVLADVRTGGSDRIGEAVAGGATGAGLLKAGTALLATGAIATGAGGLVIKHERGTGSHRAAAAAALERPASVPAPKPRTPQPVVAVHESPQVGRDGASSEHGSSSHEVAQAPVPTHRPGRQPGASAPQRHEHGDNGDSSESSRDPRHGDTIEASHDGSGDHHGDGSSGDGSASSGDSSSGDRSGDSSGDSGTTHSHDGPGSSDSPPSVPTEP
jgi:hypothetical protein